jgi:hypothetical protein
MYSGAGVTQQPESTGQHTGKDVLTKVHGRLITRKDRQRLPLQNIKSCIYQIAVITFRVVRIWKEGGDAVFPVHINKVGIGRVTIGVQEQRRVRVSDRMGVPKAPQVNICQCIAVQHKKSGGKQLKTCQHSAGGSKWLRLFNGSNVYAPPGAICNKPFDFSGLMPKEKHNVVKSMLFSELYLMFYERPATDHDKRFWDASGMALQSTTFAARNNYGLHGRSWPTHK